jgi:phage tail sheath protein FI
MSAAYSYPGVYVQELPSPVHAITAVATSITAFVGFTARGIDNRAQAIYSFQDFQRSYGGLASNSELSYSVQQFFQNGGSQAYIVRTPGHYNSATAVKYASVSFGGLIVSALSSGAWVNGQLLVDVDVIGLNLSTTAPGDPFAFNLTITNLIDGTKEYFPGLTLNSNLQNFVTNVVNDPDNGSQLVSVNAVAVPTPPTTALVVTGILGSALVSTPVTTGGVTVNYLETVNGVLATSSTTTTASADSYISLTLPTSILSTALSVKVLAQNSPIPQTVAGLASQLQQAINTTLAVSVPGASVSCSAAPSGTGTGICVNALLPNQPDAVIGFSDPATGNKTATALGLLVPQNTNVAHYALGTNNASHAETASAPAVPPDGLPGTAELIGDPLSNSGIYALTQVPIFNMLCIPDAVRASAGNSTVLDSNNTSLNPATIYATAISLCDTARAMLLIDPPPSITTVSAAVDWKSNTIGVVDPNGAAFWPRLRLPDLLNNGQLRTFAPSGLVAGVYASTDSSRGVWKAPAGIGATLNGVQNMTYQLTDTENGVLNPLGLNCFRVFPIYGPVLWGARTLVGADAFANQWKYVPVRRTALFLESSLIQGTQWVVFEPNDEPLWSAIRLNVGSFMQNLFVQGYFQGSTPDEAYFVKCDSETTTQTDIENGVVNILVGFAPLEPAEFVVIQIEQLAGQAAS